MSEHIDLDLPLHSRYASTVRAVAASVAADAGFSVDDIDDLRLGVNEAVAVVTDVDQEVGRAGRLVLRFDVGPGSVTVTARRDGVSVELAGDDLDALATRILGAVVDEFGIDGGVFTVVKRTANHAAA